ncbi:MAG: hypothetical protein J0M15_05490 [Deltaproteobacteria bacterium]|nr:hypothetical protein [Deltaproteobacteria bacterium]
MILSFSLLLFCALQLKNLHYKISSSDLIDPRLESSQDLLQLKKDFNLKPSALVIFEPKFNLGNEDFCNLKTQLIRVYNDTKEISSIFSSFDVRVPLDSEKKLYFPNIFEPCRYTDYSDSHFDFQNEDVNFKNNTLVNFAQTPWNGILTDLSFKRIVANISLFPLNPPGKFGEADVNSYNILRDLKLKNEKFNTFWAGELTFNSYFLNGIKRTQILNLLSILFILIILRVIYGTWKSGFLFILTIVFSNAIVHGLMGLFKHDINPLTAGIFFLVLISSLEDFIFISGKNIENMSKEVSPHRWRYGFRKNLFPGFFTSLTTFIGFFSLVVSELEVIRHFGIWTSVGAITEWFVVFFILPSFIKVFPYFSNWINIRSSFKLFHKNTLVTRKISVKTTVGLLLLIPICIFYGSRIQLNYSPLDMFPKDHPLRVFSQEINNHFSWVSEVSLVFSSKLSEEKILSVLGKVKNIDLVSRIESPHLIFKQLTAKSTNLTKDMIYSEIKDTNFWKRYRTNEDKTRAILYINKLDVESINKLNSKIKEICKNHDDCHLSGELVAFSDFSKQILRTLFESLIVSVFLVGLILIYISIKLENKNTIEIIISTIWGPLCLLGLISISDISINIVSSVILSIIVGLTGDNAIQYLFASKNSKIQTGIISMGLSSIHCSMVMAVCSLILLGSYFLPVRHLGALLFIALLLSLFGDLWLLKGTIYLSDSIKSTFKKKEGM